MKEWYLVFRDGNGLITESRKLDTRHEALNLASDPSVARLRLDVVELVGPGARISTVDIDIFRDSPVSAHASPVGSKTNRCPTMAPQAKTSGGQF